MIGSQSCQPVCQELLAGGLIPYYWCAENSRGEVDFLGQHKGEVLLESLVRVLKAFEAMKRQNRETEALETKPRSAICRMATRLTLRSCSTAR